MRRNACLVLFLVLAPLAIAPSVASEVASLIEVCESCHGPNGVSGHPDIPSIGGQSEDYILVSLESYQEWGRPCVKSEFRYGDTSRPASNMCEVTEDLSQEDFQALASHFSSLPFVPADQPYDPEKAAFGAQLHETHCEGCHLEGGSSSNGPGPRLAGQWMQYLRSAIKYIPTGEHLVPRPMEDKIVELNDEELEALWNFYASQD